MMHIPDTIYLFRLIHIDNLNFLLSEGVLTCPGHCSKNEHYINIGDQTLIENRKKRQIPLPPGGGFDNYVAFYFGYRQPMLYEIQKGFNNVQKRHPNEIVYLVTTFTTIKNAGLSFVFTDGHAYHNFTQFFNHENDLRYIDWNTIKLKQWNDTETDPDRKRRKQAECLIYHEVPLNLIKAFVVYNDTAKTKILSIFEKHGVVQPIYVKPQWYY